MSECEFSVRVDYVNPREASLVVYERNPGSGILTAKVAEFEIRQGEAQINLTRHSVILPAFVYAEVSRVLKVIDDNNVSYTHRDNYLKASYQEPLKVTHV